jgi:hypothetical protein
MVPRNQLINWLNSIQWQQQDGINPEAMTLIEEHLKLIRYVIDHIKKKKGVNVSEAHGLAQTPGYSTSEYNEILDELFAHGNFEGAVVREPLTLTISACYCWHLDHELSFLINPWIPLVELISMGYLVSNEDSPDGENISLLVGHKNGINEFLII